MSDQAQSGEAGSKTAPPLSTGASRLATFTGSILLACMLLVVVLAAATAPAPAHERRGGNEAPARPASRPPAGRCPSPARVVQVEPRGQVALLRRKRIRVRLEACRRTRVRLRAGSLLTGLPGSLRGIADPRVVRIGRSESRTIALRLRRRRLPRLRRCTPQRIVIRARVEPVVGRIGRDGRIARARTRLRIDRPGCQSLGTAAWEQNPSSPLARTEVGGAAVGRFVYVVGGYGLLSEPSRAVERYDTEHDTWEAVAPLPMHLNHPAVAGYGGDLYVVGGYLGTPFSLGIGSGNPLEASRAFLRYDPEKDQWSAMPDAPTARGAAAVAVIGDRLYLAGGADALQALHTFEIFDFRTQRWTAGPPLPLATEHVAGSGVDGAFYVVGGRPQYGGANYSFVQRYQPATGEWGRVADLLRARAGFAAATACGRIVAFGGEDPRSGPPGTIAEVEAYDPDGDEWQPLPAMLTPRHGLAGAAVGSRVFALEGGDVTFAAITNVAESLRLPCRAGPAQAGG